GRLSKPRKTSLNWFIPALVKSSVGSSPGTTGLDGTTVWPFDAKKLRNVERMSAAFTDGFRRRRSTPSGRKGVRISGPGSAIVRHPAPARRAGPSAVVVGGGAAAAGRVARRRRPVGQRRRCRRGERERAPQQPLGVVAVARVVGDAERDRDRALDGADGVRREQRSDELERDALAVAA